MITVTLLVIGMSLLALDILSLVFAVALGPLLRLEVAGLCVAVFVGLLI